MEYKGNQWGRFFPVQWLRSIMAGLQSVLDRSISVSGDLDGHLLSGLLQSWWTKGHRRVVSDVCVKGPLGLLVLTYT